MQVSLLSQVMAIWFDFCLLASSDCECNEIAVFGLLIHRNMGAGFVGTFGRPAP